MPTEFLSPCADELTPDQPRVRIASIFARAALRRLAVLRMSKAPVVNESKSAKQTSPTLKLIAPSRPRTR